jgi:hypothetical protein
MKAAAPTPRRFTAETLVDYVRTLKASDGSEIQVHGSANLIQTLLRRDLVDAFSLLTFPVVLGTGYLTGNHTDSRLHGMRPDPRRRVQVAAAPTSPGCRGSCRSQPHPDKCKTTTPARRGRRARCLARLRVACHIVDRPVDGPAQVRARRSGER